MMNKAKRALALFFFIFISFIIVRESLFHFNADVVTIKRKHYSAQKHWHIKYSYHYVYYDSPIRYENDFEKISDIIEPGYAVLSDLATSYYAAARLPVYIRNNHRHHVMDNVTREFLKRKSLCRLGNPHYRKDVLKYLQRDVELSKTQNWPILRYFLLNKDKTNSVLKRDCISQRSHYLQTTLPSIGKLLFEGKYINLYQLDSYSTHFVK